MTPRPVLNLADAPLRYLAIGTMHAPDVMEYPDSDKIGVAAGVNHREGEH